MDRMDDTATAPPATPAAAGTAENGHPNKVAVTHGRRLTYDIGMQVIVVDDCCTDFPCQLNTEATAAAMGANMMETLMIVAASIACICERLRS